MNEMKQTAAAQSCGETCLKIALAIENIKAPEPKEQDEPSE